MPENVLFKCNNKIGLKPTEFTCRFLTRRECVLNRACRHFGYEKVKFISRLLELLTWLIERTKTCRKVKFIRRFYFLIRSMFLRPGITECEQNYTHTGISNGPLDIKNATLNWQNTYCLLTY